MAASMTSEKGGDEPPPYSQQSNLQSGRGNDYVPGPVEDRKRSSSNPVVDSNSRHQNYETNGYADRNQNERRYYGSDSEASSPKTGNYRPNDYGQAPEMGRREFASNPNFNSDPRSQDYQNGYTDRPDPSMGRGYGPSNPPFNPDPRNQQYQTNDYTQQNPPPMGRTNYQSNGYAEPMMGRGYGAPNQAFTSDPRAQQYQTNEYMQQNQPAMGRGFSPFGGHDTGRGYDDTNDYGGRRHGGRRGGGGILHRRRERKAERGGGLLSMGFGAVSSMMSKK